jgi:hypothetical protein
MAISRKSAGTGCERGARWRRGAAAFQESSAPRSAKAMEMTPRNAEIESQ